MKYPVLFFLFFGALFFLPGIVLADCESEIKSAEKMITSISKDVHFVDKERLPRLNAFLNDGKQVLEWAKKLCQKDETSLNRLEALGKALVAQGNLSAALLIVRDARQSKSGG